MTNMVRRILPIVVLVSTAMSLSGCIEMAVSYGAGAHSG